MFCCDIPNRTPKAKGNRNANSDTCFNKLSFPKFRKGTKKYKIPTCQIVNSKSMNI